MTLNANNIAVKIDKTQILHGVDFNAEPGQITAIIGPNGCGKTTLLKALTGEVCYEGHITLNGMDIARTPPVQIAQMRAVLPQNTDLAFPFTVIEVIRLGLTAGLSALDTATAESLPLKALQKVGLAGFANRLYQDLSGGEKQRIQLARILVQVWNPVFEGKARWLLLDEPVSALDIAHQLLVMNVMRDFCQSGGGVVAVMHDLNLTAMYADKVYLIKAGKLLVAGTSETVISDKDLSQAYNCKLRTKSMPEGSRPWLLPHQASLR